ncbi:hypothetical protein PR202_ga24590 [Eleusine coracana subsp. coracana]|uniref:Uncharacterized protein n=1 Tax=Eleusine coracana subsp. coracana TaxID=191504 RepID=A0AAV5D9L5_ELECO|nr:hypothetical protein PR202_ga24590 [Eleusine coracana subsp. coracana]
MASDPDPDRHHLLTLYYLPLTSSLMLLLSGLYLAWRGSYGINFLQWGILATGLFLLAIFIVVDREIPGCLNLTERQFMQIHFVGLLVATPVLLCLVIAVFYSIRIDVSISDTPDIQHMWARTPVREYDIADYDWPLRRRMANKQYWGTIAAVLRHDHVCDGMRPLVRDPKTGAYYVDLPSKKWPHDAGLSPIEAGVLADIQRIWSQIVGLLLAGIVVYHAIQLPFVVKVLKFLQMPMAICFVSLLAFHDSQMMPVIASHKQCCWHLDFGYSSPSCPGCPLTAGCGQRGLVTTNTACHFCRAASIARSSAPDA